MAWCSLHRVVGRLEWDPKAWQPRGHLVLNTRGIPCRDVRPGRFLPQMNEVVLVGQSLGLVHCDILSLLFPRRVRDCHL